MGGVVVLEQILEEVRDVSTQVVFGSSTAIVRHHSSHSSSSSCCGCWRKDMIPRRFSIVQVISNSAWTQDQRRSFFVYRNNSRKKGKKAKMITILRND